MWAQYKSLIFKSVWIHFLPSPRISAHIFDVVLSLPTKLTVCLGGIGVTGCNISGAARNNFIWYVHTGCLLKIVYNIQYAVPVTRAEIVDVQTCIVFDF